MKQANINAHYSTSQSSFIKDSITYKKIKLITISK